MGDWGDASDLLGDEADEDQRDKLRIARFDVGVPYFMHVLGAVLRQDSHRLPEGADLGATIRCQGDGCPLCGIIPVETAVFFPATNLVDRAPCLIRGTMKKVGGRDVRRAQSLVSRLAAFVPRADTTAVVEIVKPSIYQFTVTGRPDLAEKMSVEYPIADLLATVQAEADDVLDQVIPAFSPEEILADPIIAEFLRLRRKP